MNLKQRLGKNGALVVNPVSVIMSQCQKEPGQEKLKMDLLYGKVVFVRTK